MKSKKIKFLDLLNDWITIFLPKVRGVAENTIRSYKYTFILLLQFFETVKGIIADKITFELLNYTNILDFLNWLEKDRECSISTRNQRLAALNSFAKYAQSRSFEATIVFKSQLSRIPQKKQKNKKRSFFTLEEVGLLFKIPNEATFIGLRDKILLTTMYATGARAQEICDLKVGDIKFQPNGEAYVHILGKGSKRRTVKMGVKPTKLLKDYLTRRRIMNQKDAYVFPSQGRTKMTTANLEMIFKKYIKIAKEQYPGKFLEETYTPHSMRHTTACHMIEAGNPIIAIKNFLGHESVQTTEIYAEMMQSTIDEHIKKWNNTWFSKVDENTEQKEDKIPDFLRI